MMKRLSAAARGLYIQTTGAMVLRFMGIFMIMVHTPATTLADDQGPIKPAGTPGLAPPFHWVSTGPVLQVQADPARKIVSIKDPSVVFYERSLAHLRHVRAGRRGDGGVGHGLLKLRRLERRGQGRAGHYSTAPRTSPATTARRRSSTSRRRSSGT